MFDLVKQTEIPSSEPDALQPVDASDELLATLRRIDQLEAQAAATLQSMNEAPRWRKKGYTSATAFLKHRAGFTAGRAMRLVGRANSLEQMPITADHFRRGILSVDQVDVLTDAFNFAKEAFAAEEVRLVGLAAQLPFVEELSRLLEYWKQQVDEAGVELDQNALDSLRGVRVRRQGGVGRVYICMNEEETDLFINALDPGPPGPGDTRTQPQRRVDRLVELARASMDRPQLLVHVNLDNLVGADSAAAANPLAETEYGTVLTPGGVSRLACDATISRIVFGPSGHPVDVGRKYRLFPEPMRRAIIGRDRHCRFPGCDRPPRWCDVHHILHWLRGGETCVDNGVLLCRFHHTLVHDGGWSAVGTATELWIFDDLGKQFASSTPAAALARAP